MSSWTTYVLKLRGSLCVFGGHFFLQIFVLSENIYAWGKEGREGEGREERGSKWGREEGIDKPADVKNAQDLYTLQRVKIWG